jgi:hypothetical protein
MCELQDFSTIECEGGEEADDEDNSRPYQDLKLNEGKPIVHSIPEAPDVEWSGFIVADSMYCFVKNKQLSAGSRECLASLMDEAESLNCRYLVIFFKKDLPQSELHQIMRTFQFVGFSLLPPKHQLIPKVNTQYCFMAYSVQ